MTSPFFGCRVLMVDTINRNTKYFFSLAFNFKNLQDLTLNVASFDVTYDKGEHFDEIYCGNNLSTTCTILDKESFYSCLCNFLVSPNENTTTTESPSIGKTSDNKDKIFSLFGLPALVSVVIVAVVVMLVNTCCLMIVCIVYIQCSKLDNNYNGSNSNYKNLVLKADNSTSKSKSKSNTYTYTSSGISSNLRNQKWQNINPSSNSTVHPYTPAHGYKFEKYHNNNKNDKNNKNKHKNRSRKNSRNKSKSKNKNKNKNRKSMSDKNKDNENDQEKKEQKEKEKDTDKGNRKEKSESKLSKLKQTGHLLAAAISPNVKAHGGILSDESATEFDISRSGDSTTFPTSGIASIASPASNPASYIPRNSTSPQNKSKSISKYSEGVIKYGRHEAGPPQFGSAGSSGYGGIAGTGPNGEKLRYKDIELGLGSTIMEDDEQEDLDILSTIESSNGDGDGDGAGGAGGIGGGAITPGDFSREYKDPDEDHYASLVGSAVTGSSEDMFNSEYKYKMNNNNNNNNNRNNYNNNNNNDIDDNDNNSNVYDDNMQNMQGGTNVKQKHRQMKPMEISDNNRSVHTSMNTHEYVAAQYAKTDERLKRTEKKIENENENENANANTNTNETFDETKNNETMNLYSHSKTTINTNSNSRKINSDSNTLVLSHYKNNSNKNSKNNCNYHHNYNYNYNPNSPFAGFESKTSDHNYDEIEIDNNGEDDDSQIDGYKNGDTIVEYENDSIVNNIHENNNILSSDNEESKSNKVGKHPIQDKNKMAPSKSAMSKHSYSSQESWAPGAPPRRPLPKLQLENIGSAPGPRDHQHGQEKNKDKDQDTKTNLDNPMRSMTPNVAAQTYTGSSSPLKYAAV